MRMANRPNVAFVFQTMHTATHLCVNRYYNHHHEHPILLLTWYPSKVALLATGLKGSYKNWFPGWDQSNWWICKDCSTVERSQRAVESRCEKARGWKFIPMVRRSRLRRIFTFLLGNFTGNQTWNGQKVTMSLIPLSANLEKNISFLENHFCQSCLWQSWKWQINLAIWNWL